MEFLGRDFKEWLLDLASSRIRGAWLAEFGLHRLGWPGRIHEIVGAAFCWKDRHWTQIVWPELRFQFGRFTMWPMDNMAPLPEFLVRLDEGVIRVAGTRVSLDSVIRAFQDGATPEEICLDFPSLDLPKVYSVLAYYLTRRETVDAYLLTQQRFVEMTRQELQARHSPFFGELRRRVAARRALPPACA